MSYALVHHNQKPKGTDTMNTYKGECAECGKPFTARSARARFCPAENNYPSNRRATSKCEKAFNNRRAVRGAEIYDLVMAWRFQRADADKIDIRGLLGRVASAYRDADKSFRDGRKSWDLSAAIDRIPLGYSVEGDKR